MISEKENTRLSKLLSYALRHNPHEIGIVLDENGWTDVHVLLNRLAENGEAITIDILKHVVATNAKKRFSFNEDQSLIRANQGHSVEVSLDYPEKQPPVFLYHGTVDRFITSIFKDGLQKMDRHHVHLSTDINTAVKVAQRRGKPSILKIHAGDMFLQKYIFYISDNGVWLTDTVPPQFIECVP